MSKDFIMNEKLEGLHTLVRKFLRPVVRLCVRRGIRLQDLYELLKCEFVIVANEQLHESMATPSISKISVMTGVQRPEVKRILEAKQPKVTKDYITRVLGLWCGNRSYYDKDGPKPLRLDHQQPSFHRLVAAVSTDLNPHTILFELERLNLVFIQEHRVTLSSQLYSTFGDELTTLDFGANDVNDLMHSIQENAERRVKTPNLHARTEFDNIPDEMIAQIREWLLECGSAFHKKVHHYLSRRDKDMHPSLREKPGRNRVILGSFSRIESIDNE